MIIVAVAATFYLTMCAVSVANAAGVIDEATFYAFGAVMNAGAFFFLIWDGIPGWASLNGLAALWCAYMWWRNRRKGKWKRAAKELGAKSQARVEALVRQMTPSPILSPVGAS